MPSVDSTIHPLLRVSYGPDEANNLLSGWLPSFDVDLPVDPRLFGYKLLACALNLHQIQ